jgi:uncharacterized membrane protein required for colicin V production
MTDLAIIVLTLLYFGLGYWTGVVRRVIGVIGLFLAFFAATASGPTAANVVLQVYPTMTVSDAFMLGYFVVVVIVLAIVEVLASFYHGQLQLAAILVDKGSGAVIGAITALVGASVVLWLLLGASQPLQGSPDGAQIQVHDAITKAIIAPVLVGPVAKLTKVVFSPVIPNDPTTYFNGQQAQVQH